MSSGPNPLTNERIAAALKDARRSWLSESICLRGWGRLVARISNPATALFYFRYCIGGRSRFITIGPHSEYKRQGFYTLEQARAEAARLSRLYRDPATRDVRQALNAVLTLPEGLGPLDTTDQAKGHPSGPTGVGPSRSAEWATLSVEQLQQLVWQLPRVQLAKIFNVSDVAIGRRCKRSGIKMPPPGYWARVAAGKEPPPNGTPSEDWQPNSSRCMSSGVPKHENRHR